VADRDNVKGGQMRCAAVLACCSAAVLGASSTASGASLQEALTPLIGVPAYTVTPDLDGDGRPDLVTAMYKTDQLVVRVNHGGRRFGPAQRYPGGVAPAIAETGDFNGDGREDVVVTNQGADYLSVFLSRGDGTLQPAQRYRITDPAYGPVQGGGGYAVSVADFNRDRRLDIVTATTGPDYLSVLDGNGDGTFRKPRAYGMPSGFGVFPFDFAEGDFDGDGRLDLAASGAGSLTVFKGGDGSFRPIVTYELPGLWLSWVNSGDHNGDGRLDLVFDSTATNELKLMLGNGDGTFRSRATFSSLGFAPQGFCTHDLNGDGRLDLAVVNAGSPDGRGNLAVFMGKQNGRFRKGVTYAGGLSPFNCRVTDLDGDARVDIAVVDGLPGVVSVYYGRGRGAFGQRVAYGM